MNNQHNGMNTGFGNFLSLMSEEHLFQVFNHHREISHLSKETVFQELKALVTYGGLSYEQKSLIYKVIEDNYKDLILSNLKDKNTGGNPIPSLLSRLIPADSDNVKIFFVERVQDQEQVRVYHGHGDMNLQFIYVTTFDKDLKPVTVNNSMVRVSVSDLVSLMVEKIKVVAPNFKPAVEYGKYYTSMDIIWFEKGIKEVYQPTLDLKFSENGDVVLPLFGFIPPSPLAFNSDKVKDLYKSVGFLLGLIPTNKKEFIKGVGLENLYTQRVQKVRVVFNVFQEIENGEDTLLDETILDLDLID